MIGSFSLASIKVLNFQVTEKKKVENVMRIHALTYMN